VGLFPVGGNTDTVLRDSRIQLEETLVYENIHDSIKQQGSTKSEVQG
jgi:hypothetical protein